MIRQRAAIRQRFAAVFFFLFAGSMAWGATQGGPQWVLIACPPQGICDFLKINSLIVEGKTKLLLFAVNPGSVSSPLSVKGAKQAKINEMNGMVIRNSATGVAMVFNSDGRASQTVVTPQISGPTVNAATAWNGASIDYKEAPSGKAGVLYANGFAGLLFDADGQAASVALARAMVADAEFPRRNDLIRGAARFASASPQFVSLRKSEADVMTSSLKSYRDGSVTPDRLLNTLTKGLEAAGILAQIAELNADEIKTRDELSQSLAELQRKSSIAAAFASGGFWDEFAKKMNELGVARRSYPDLIAKEPDALRQAASAHMANAKTLESVQPPVPDRVLDEASIAFQRSPCDFRIQDYLGQARRTYLDKENLSEVNVFAPEVRRKLDELALELGVIEKDHPEAALDRIRNALPESQKSATIQMLKAQSLKNLQRLAEARDVLANVARNIPLDTEQKKEWVRLDTDLSVSLKEDLAKYTTQVTELMNLRTQGGYEKALSISTASLTMDPQAFFFLDQQIRAYAMLNRTDDANKQLNWWLNTGNASCADTTELSQLGELTSPPVASIPLAAGQLRHWISGEQYTEGSLFYDPVSLGFASRVKRIWQDKGEGTIFEWREFQLVAVASGLPGTDITSQNNLVATFVAIPYYRPRTVYMAGISPRGIPDSAQPLYKLAYVNDPTVNVVKGAVQARGWAANPFFHPFYWKKLFLFDFTYDDLGRVIRAAPVTVDDNQSLDVFSQTLTFKWHGNTRKLLSISGDKGYSRVMVYDNKNRLTEEKITDSYSKGNGSIRYQYKGDSLTPTSAVAESTFYSKGKKMIEFMGAQ